MTLVNTVPTPMSELLKLGPLPESVKTVCLAGEPLPRELVARIYANDHVESLYNLYGPSEDTTYSTVRQCLNRENGSGLEFRLPIPAPTCSTAR
ncbi:AMP-binding enzyme [Rhizobium sp. AN6A]|nr:AMP-binding enzyme [Rhizobium sp. AN6A]